MHSMKYYQKSFGPPLLFVGSARYFQIAPFPPCYFISLHRNTAIMKPHKIMKNIIDKYFIEKNAALLWKNDKKYSKYGPRGAKTLL